MVADLARDQDVAGAQRDPQLGEYGDCLGGGGLAAHNTMNLGYGEPAANSAININVGGPQSTLIGGRCVLFQGYSILCHYNRALGTIENSSLCDFAGTGCLAMEIKNSKRHPVMIAIIATTWA